jgi:hypothetical protein
MRIRAAASPVIPRRRLQPSAIKSTKIMTLAQVATRPALLWIMTTKSLSMEQEKTLIIPARILIFQEGLFSLDA